jgi:hypothetical protein
MEDQAIKQQRKESQPKPQADREQKPRNFWKPERHTCKGRRGIANDRNQPRRRGTAHLGGFGDPAPKERQEKKTLPGGTH